MINFFSTIPAILFMDRWGRRKVLMIGATGMGCSQLIVGTIFAVYKNSWAEHTSAGWAACVFIWIYIANFAFSIGCVNWIMPSEMFPPGVRGKAVGVAISTNWLSNVSRSIYSSGSISTDLNSLSLPSSHLACSRQSPLAPSTSFSVRCYIGTPWVEV